MVLEQSADCLEPLTNGIAYLTDLVAEDMESVNQIILSKAGSNVEMIPEIANHLISSGGKRLRPMLTLATSRMYNYEGDAHIKLAASVEFMHTATLLHDDVVDESDVRRGKLAARKLWGNQASVLVGDYLLGQAFKMMVSVKSIEALEILSNASAVIAEGEVMQLGASQNMATNEDQYMAVINAKTATLFSAATEVGPVVSNCQANEKSTCREYGQNLGMAFQLIDDALDYNGKKSSLGKNIGDDFREGKITYPVILAYRAGSAQEQEFWKRCLVDRKLSDGDFEEAVSIIQKYDAIVKTVEKANYFGDFAMKYCEKLPAGKYSEALYEVVKFCVNRVN